MNAMTAILMILAILFASCSPSAANGDNAGTADGDRAKTETKEPVKGDTNGDVLTAAEKPCEGGKKDGRALCKSTLPVVTSIRLYVLPHSFLIRRLRFYR